jgi:transcriptional regulator GlxA family with amidase domain
MSKAILLFLLIITASLHAQAPVKTIYSCPPCGKECDKIEFDMPGNCPHCKMSLVKQTEDTKQNKAKTVGILLFDGVQIIDFTGPYEVLGQAGYKVFTVAGSPMITTNMNMKVTPDYNFQNCPEADIFIIPGGNVNNPRKNPEYMGWVKDYSNKSDLVMSVCNGAMVLAQTGLLDGLTATTFHKVISDMTEEFPKTKVVSDQRFVDNGKFITTAGLSSGIDGALHIVEKLQGKTAAQLVALNLEYDWHPEDNYARAALADRHLYKIFEGGGDPSISAVDLLNTKGNRDKWLLELEFTANGTADQLEKVMERLIVEKVQWKKEKNVSSTKSNWSFKSTENQSWNGTLEVRPMTSSKQKFLVVVEIERNKV